HLGDPGIDQFDPFTMYHVAADLRHPDARIVAGHAVGQDRLAGLARHDAEAVPSRALPGRDRRLAQAEVARRVFTHVQPQARGVGRPLLVVAVAAVDVEVGARAVVEAGVRGVAPVGVAR